jgi:hypothetical protein
MGQGICEGMGHSRMHQENVLSHLAESGRSPEGIQSRGHSRKCPVHSCRRRGHHRKRQLIVNKLINKKERLSMSIAIIL